MELTIDGDVQQHNWAVGPHAEKTRQGRHDRYFACHSFRFQDAKFVTLSGAEVSESRQAELAMIDEGDEGAEDEDEEEGAGDMAEGDGAGEFVKSEEPAVAERGKALVETMRAAMPPHSTPPLTAPGGTMTLAQYDAGMEMAQDGGQLTARQKESPALEQLQQGEDFEKFSQAVTSGGAHVSIKCFVADWTQGRSRGAVRLESTLQICQTLYEYRLAVLRGVLSVLRVRRRAASKAGAVRAHPSRQRCSRQPAPRASRPPPGTATRWTCARATAVASSSAEASCRWGLSSSSTAGRPMLRLRRRLLPLRRLMRRQPRPTPTPRWRCAKRRTLVAGSQTRFVDAVACVVAGAADRPPLARALGVRVLKVVCCQELQVARMKRRRL